MAKGVEAMNFWRAGFVFVFVLGILWISQEEAPALLGSFDATSDFDAGASTGNNNDTFSSAGRGMADTPSPLGLTRGSPPPAFGSTLPRALVSMESGNRLNDAVSRDATLRTKVMDSLSAEPLFQSQGLSADVRGGVVRLSGRVSSIAARERAADIARQSDGVVRIVNEISVDGSTTQK